MGEMARKGSTVEVSFRLKSHSVRSLGPVWSGVHPRRQTAGIQTAVAMSFSSRTGRKGDYQRKGLRSES